MTTYKQDLEELNISAEQYDNIINYIYNKSTDDLVALAKAIKSGAKVLPALQRAFERVLYMRAGERAEAYKIYFS